ncbi:MAG TPA: Fe-S cluster assembly protein SufD, partial [Thermoanaerobaculia bacterium]|nr:Fe-S cluster assembly protein SufD [Thermoanaerobaculia bacterium]
THVPWALQKNGQPELRHGRLLRGVRVVSLKEILAKEPETVQPYLSTIAGLDRNPFAALNTAFLENGVFVEIGRGIVVEEPIELRYTVAPDGEPRIAHRRVLIVAGEASQATVIETYAGQGDQPYFTNAVTEIAAGEGAVLEHYKIQRENTAAFHMQTIAVRQGRASRFTSQNVALGGRIARTDLDVSLEAEGSECTLYGLFIATGTQHLDNHTTIDHAKPHCTSRELYKGILDGKSRGVFHGKILVRPEAQKTDAMQTNKNLLLSSEALVNSTPALEILADDVKCKHGSTIGQLDANALFYLRSRGIGETEARSLLTYAFAADVVGRIRFEPIRASIEAVLGLRLPGAAGVFGEAR